MDDLFLPVNIVRIFLLVNKYKSIENMNLSVSTFMNSNTLEFAQKIFNNMNVQAIEDAYNMIINQTEGEQDGEN